MADENHSPLIVPHCSPEGAEPHPVGAAVLPAVLVSEETACTKEWIAAVVW